MRRARPKCDVCGAPRQRGKRLCAGCFAALPNAVARAINLARPGSRGHRTVAELDAARSADDVVDIRGWRRG